MFGAAVLLTACADLPTAAPPAADDRPAVDYIVMLRDTTTDAGVVSARLARTVPSLRAVQASAAGVSARIVDADTPVEVLSSLHAAVMRVSAADAERLRRDPAVAVVEPVRAMILHSVTTVPTINWHLDRVNQAALPLDGRMTRFGNDGRGVRIAIFDTGIRWTHAEVQGRVTAGYDAFWATTKTSSDSNGHGTAVASLAAGATLGAAPFATILDVKVLNAKGQGTGLELLRGADWVIAEKRRVAGPMVVNMSMGIPGGSPFADLAVERLRAAGITVVVSAGNDNADACGTSPARAPGAITVTVVDNLDLLPDYANGGTCVDVSAPGHRVRAAWHVADNFFRLTSGTSTAAPVAAGVAAAYLAVRPTATPDDVAAWIVAESTKDRLLSVKLGMPNRILALTRLPAATPTPTPTPTPAPTPTPTPTPRTPTPAPTPTPTPGTPTPAPVVPVTMTLTSRCVARTCTLNAGVPTGMSATEAATLVYHWNPGIGATVSGMNLRQQTVHYRSPTSAVVTVTALRGQSTVARATITVTVN